MKKKIILIIASFTISAASFTQTTQINSNNDLTPVAKLNSSKAILKSIDNRLWVSDGTAAGTFQLSATLTYERSGAVLNNHFIFPGMTTASGNELWITDGTVAGTILLKDINPGTASSSPDDDFALLNGQLYFTAETPESGRELWKTNGTLNGTTLVKDIMPGPAASALRGKYHLFSAGSYLLLNVATLQEGYELWRSDGTANGTILVKDINPGQAASEPQGYVLYNDMVLFAAKHASYGLELWKTDGTAAGTQLVKDIREGTAGSFYYLSIFQFNGTAYFTADNGSTGEEIWSTDGTTANTRLLKEIQPGNFGSVSVFTMATAVRMDTKFIFPAYTHDTGVELWESDGTTNGTKMLKEIAEGMEMGIPMVLAPYDINNPGKQRLFQDSKFFFIMILPASGSALWVSDGTAAGTYKVKDINAAEIDGIEHLSYAYTQNALYFTADNGVVGDELWRSDGTTAGTHLLADINTGTGNAEILFSYFTVNNKLLFEAQDGDHGFFSDMYSLDVTSTLPIQLSDLTVTGQDADALLQWSTIQEINSKDFTIERSYDAIHFAAVGSVKAAGSSSTKKTYTFTDRDIVNSGRKIIYYRLISNDNNGKPATSKVVSLHVKRAAEWSIKLNENPVRNNINITVNGITTPVQFTITDLAGKRVCSIQYNTADGLITLPADKLATGIYILTAETTTKRKAIKLLKQ